MKRSFFITGILVIILLFATMFFVKLVEAANFMQTYVETNGLLYSAVKRIKPGMIEDYTVDNLYNRQPYFDENGDYATVRTMTLGIGNGKYINIPTISDFGQLMNKQEAIEYARNSGKHLGVFDSLSNALYDAEKLHQEQDDYYRSKVGDSKSLSEYILKCWCSNLRQL